MQSRACPLAASRAPGRECQQEQRLSLRGAQPVRYPWWYVPFVTAPMLIAAVAVVHVLIAHYAVGGGLFLAVETAYAYRRSDTAYLAYLRRHARFFMLLTVVFGAVTGIGIWWTMALASPLATELLIRIFVFVWATEWVAFAVELVSVFLFVYGFGRLPARLHVRLAVIYAAAAWVSLVLITSITAFMLNSGRWPEEPLLINAVLNPQFLPQVVARTGGALMLCTLYVYLHATFTAKDPELRNLIQRRSTRPALLGAVLIVLGGLAWYAALPPSAQAALAAASVLNVLMVGIFLLTAVVFVALYLGPARHPGWLTPGFSLLLFLCGLGAFATGEFLREAVRKPYVIYNVLTGSQYCVTDTARLRRQGVLNSSAWIRLFLAREFPELLDDNGSVRLQALKNLPHQDQARVGQAIFQYLCNDCHADRHGYSAVGYLIHGWNREMLVETIHHLHRTNFFMPPWVGTEEEAEALAAYLEAIAPKRPEGMLFELERDSFRSNGP